MSSQSSKVQSSRKKSSKSEYKGKVLFAVTVLREFKPPYVREGFMGLIDDLKHMGISKELLDDLQHDDRQVNWWTEDENEKMWVAVEIIKR